MKSNTLIPRVLAAAAALLLSATLHAKNYKMIVVSGQSNSGDWSSSNNYGGIGPLPDDVKAWLQSPLCDALILTQGAATTDSETLVTMHDELQRTTNSQGYGQIAAYAEDKYWKAIDPDSKIVLVKHGVGGTPLGYWVAAGRNTLNPYANGVPPWSLYYQDEQLGHKTLFDRIRRAKSLLAGSTIEGIGFLWYQPKNGSGMFHQPSEAYNVMDYTFHCGAIESSPPR